MTELEKIAYAKSFIDKLANGVNPLDDTRISENDIVNNVRISRCFSYVSDILRQVIENGGTQPTIKKRLRKKDFCLSEKELKNITVSDVPLTVSEISNHLNSLVNLEYTQKISAPTINNWLLSLQLLEAVEQPDGKTKKLPTQQGKEFGIFAEERTGQYGRYITVLFSSSAQRFIYDNVEAIVNTKKNKKRFEYKGQPWTEEQEKCLIELYGKGVEVAEIAACLKRNNGGIRARLKKLGFI